MGFEKRPLRCDALSIDITLFEFVHTRLDVVAMRTNACHRVVARAFVFKAQG